MNNLNLMGLLENHALFRHISAAELGALQSEVVKLEFDKGSLLLRKGDTAHASYIVVFGLVKLSLPSVQGNDKVLELIRAGQSFGEAMMFLDEPYPFHAEALEHTLALKVPRQALLSLLASSPVIARQMMAGLSYRLLGFIRSVERYSLQSASQRVVDYLLQTSAMQSTNDVRLELKKHLLASLLNVSPETLSRVLHQLSDEKLIRVCGSTIHIGCATALQIYQTEQPAWH
ncbi:MULTISPECIES: Crp/Fnr family transcriptional regulator [unclassified Undibacterium]|uniref:Crp/Fnr family transcriptional regulator n=1 Tax=unclassified Undibacterium TaxID=2630295 RepID=UPI002AC899D4|nr:MULTISPECIES: Crp/Fnr family transcriptional regulator [unclassified Undibacterium]MEB0138085.1 Crp/Fnr family transcriptional regulator [Undibacterium sp. CCC2.1]MEB0171177.1 Crp/Fnr family transcriptional regulator [Undibacterium sp. CCC1.1]MEB0175222.1 Crp/Fnr family transcriptional regulator [Undibacterium sp. CCC3.4]MEB0214630.1 Crp/Fnr family transcriptional regulator [Undibacterium sp. 5I2]WPX42398.1 Crp/Fnr family transcriptional regulator [Undibacterium sp. CCC3.4]